MLDPRCTYDRGEHACRDACRRQPKRAHNEQTKRRAANGGAAFLVIYLAAVIFIGAPVMLAELTLGRRTQRNAVGAFKALRESERVDAMQRARDTRPSYL